MLLCTGNEVIKETPSLVVHLLVTSNGVLATSVEQTPRFPITGPITPGSGDGSLPP